MEGYRSLSHSRYDCKYHVVFVPKMRKKRLYGKVREYLRKIFHELARQESSRIIAGHMATTTGESSPQTQKRNSADGLKINNACFYGYKSIYLVSGRKA